MTGYRVYQSSQIVFSVRNVNVGRGVGGGGGREGVGVGRGGRSDFQLQKFVWTYLYVRNIYIKLPLE